MGRSREQSLFDSYQGAADIIHDTRVILEDAQTEKDTDEETINYLNDIINNALARLRDFY